MPGDTAVLWEATRSPSLPGPAVPNGNDSDKGSGARMGWPAQRYLDSYSGSEKEADSSSEGSLSSVTVLTPERACEPCEHGSKCAVALHFLSQIRPKRPT